MGNEKTATAVVDPGDKKWTYDQKFGDDATWNERLDRVTTSMAGRIALVFALPIFLPGALCFVVTFALLALFSSKWFGRVIIVLLSPLPLALAGLTFVIAGFWFVVSSLLLLPVATVVKALNGALVWVFTGDVNWDTLPANVLLDVLGAWVFVFVNLVEVFDKVFSTKDESAGGAAENPPEIGLCEA